MPQERIYTGTPVECSDGPLGVVEKVCQDLSGILVRRGYVSDLLKVPQNHITEINGRIKLDTRFDETEISAIENTPDNDQKNIVIEGQTEASPFAEEVLGGIDILLPGGPATG